MNESTGTLVVKNFPDDLHHELKVAAVKRRESLAVMVARAVRHELACHALNTIPVPFIEGDQVNIAGHPARQR